jgi:MFS family permease
MIPRQFLVENRRWLGAGVLMTFASSFGQTYFIALFGAEIRAEFALSDGAFGGLYTLGTLASAACLTMAGGLTDRFRARVVAVAILALYAAICVAMARVDGPVALAVVIFGLRFCGQGMMSQIAMTAMGRWFRAQRGRAVAIAGFGYSLAEAILPLAGVGLMALGGWRGVWLVAAGLLLIAAPVLLRMLAEERTPRQWAAEDGAPGLHGRHWTRAEALRHWLFAPIAAGVLGPPLIGTSLFFQQAALAEEKGWSLAAVASAYPAYSAVTVACSFLAGWLVDRFGARRLLPAYQLPMAAGCFLLSSGDALWTIWATFALFGVTQGAAVALLGALWPELYGTRHMGAIRGLAVSAMVFATALGPGITGALLDLGAPLAAQFAGFGVLQLAVCAGFAALAGAAAREAAAARPV